MMPSKSALVPVEAVEQRILLIRGEKVILDADLAAFYGVTTKRLNEQVRRNQGRFPADFLFQLSREEKAEVVAKCDHLRNLKYAKALPNAFTEHGAIMAASILSSGRAMEMSVLIVRAFVRLRKQALLHQEVSRRLDDLEGRLGGHDRQIASLVEAIRRLMSSEEIPAKRRIGF
jgi:hypothetical protein